MDDDKRSLEVDELPRISTGNAGLDDILGGGIDPQRMYLFEGQPGSGKTTLALEFLLEGARAGEPTLYITLSETERASTSPRRGLARHPAARFRRGASGHGPAIRPPAGA